MISRIIKKTVDLSKIQKVDQLEGPLYQLENGGHTFEITCLMDGAAASVSGTVSARFLRADEETVYFTGTLTGNVASITLPQSCYNVNGRFGLVVFVAGNDITSAIYAVAGSVYRSTSDHIIDPTEEIPSLEDLIAKIGECEEATADAQQAASFVTSIVASAYSTSVVYTVGDYCTYEGALYRCTAETDGAFDPADWEAVKVGSEFQNVDGQIDDLKSALKQSDNELFRLSGYLNQNYVKGRQRYVDAGVEKFANNSRWISPAQGEYIELKSGDMIVAHQSRYHFRVCYSTDNKATWTMTSEKLTQFTMPSDAIAWIPIITTTTATDEDVETILNKHIIEIIRNGVNLLGSINANVNGVMDALNISPNSGIQIEAIKDGTTFVYVNTTATENGGTEKLFEIPCAKDDVFRIKFDFQAMESSENFDDYYLIVREIDQSEASSLRNVVFKLSELQTAADFTVYYTDTKKIIANVNLKRSGTTVSSGYDEEISYAITVIKVLEQNDVYTEAGEAWEV